METQIVSLRTGCVREERVKFRTMSEADFIENYASGTLRKNSRLGFRYKTQYLHERVVFEFGWTWEIVPSSRLLWNDAMTIEDCKPITEAGWLCERYILMRSFEEDKFLTKYLNVEYEDGSKKEGVGLILLETSALWIPRGHVLFAIVAEYCPSSGEYLKVENPT